MDLKLSAKDVEKLFVLAFPASAKAPIAVEEVRSGYARIRIPFRNSMLRPGNVISGPALFTAADTAMYALVLSHLGPQLMAVTSNLNLNFLNKAPAGDVIAEAQLLKLGRRLVVMDVRLRTSASGEMLVAQATGSYALPQQS